MENIGIEELFSTVAVDLGWLGNIEDARKDLEVELEIANKTSKVKGKSKAKGKKKKKEKKVSGSGDSTSHKVNRSKVKDPIHPVGDVDLSSAKTLKKHGANLSNGSRDKDVIKLDDNEEDVDLTDIDIVQKTSPERCQKGFKESIPNGTTVAEDVNHDYSVHDMSDTYAVKDPDHGDAKSSDPGSHHQVFDEKQGVDKTDVNMCFNDEVKYSYTSHDSKYGCDVDLIQYKDAIDTKYDSQNDLDNYDDNLKKNTKDLSDLSSMEDESQGNSNIDLKQKETPPFLTLTERLMKNHKHKREKVKTSPDGHDNPQQFQNRSVKIKETVSSVGGEMDDNDSYHSTTNEEEVLSFQDGSKVLMSNDRQCEDQSSFNDYRDAETPNRYASDSSSDDDDNFESFLASIKKSFKATAKTPPSQDEMDDFIVNDDDPILLSSNGEEAEEKEIFYYQCENADIDIPNKVEKSVRKKDRSTSHKSLLGDSTNSEAGHFSTPFTHTHTSLRNINTPNNSRTKPRPDINSLLSDSDSESDDENAFATPMWRPSTTKTPTRLQLANNTTRKLYRSTQLTNGFGSDESDGDDSVFATPVVRPPLKTKNPPNTMPSKPHRPARKDNHYKPCGLGVQSTPSFLTSLATPPIGESSSSPYVKEFKQKKEALTSQLFKLYNETVFDNELPSDLSVTWNKRLRKTAGYCYYSKSKIGENRSSRVELSDKVCDSAERLRDTLIHELCHAAAWLINGVHDGHGRYWKYWAAKANIAHPEIPIIKRCHSYEINTKYKYQCTRCNTTIGRHSKSINTDKFCCAYCKGQLILLPMVNKDGTPARTRTPNKFAMFVKENYASTKKWNTDMKHADIMRLLSKDFATKTKI